VKHFRLTAVLLALAFTASLGVVMAAGSDSQTITMKALNGSGEDGTAVVTQTDAGLQVVISLKNAPKDTPQPTHIHAGNCGKINAAPEYPLENTVNGKGTSVVKGVKLGDLMSGKYAINVHKSGDDLATYASCGNINK
jgi:Cu/Zn superoxide dismutase